MEALKLNGYSLTLEDITEVARGFREVELAPEAVEKVNKSRNIVETKAMGEC